ncbi:MAG: PIN domain-containing protein [Thermomicrobiales bacterium]
MDANILVGELLRERGRALFGHPRLRILIAAYTWGEAEKYLPQRVHDMRLTDEGRGRDCGTHHHTAGAAPALWAARSRGARPHPA